jgi:hypothetical protein
MKEALDGRGSQLSSANDTQSRGIKSLGNRGRQHDKTTHGRVGRTKDTGEHMGVVRGFFFIIFSGLTVE